MIKLRTYNLEALNKNNHYTLIRKMASDPKIIKYISPSFADFVTPPNNQNDFHLGKTYVLCRDSKYIGMMGTFDLDRNNVVELWYLVADEYRNKGHGDRFLGEITLYLNNNILNLDDIKLKINKDNLYSNKIAIDNGYNFIKREDNINTYFYFKKQDKHIKRI